MTLSTKLEVVHNLLQRRQHAKKFAEVWSCGFRDMRVDKQTDALRHTYTPITIGLLRTPAGEEVTYQVYNFTLFTFTHAALG